MNRAIVSGTFGLVLSVLLSACGSTPNSNFYTLNAINRNELQSPVPVQNHTIGIKVGPVTIPDTLDQPQIISRIGSNRLVYDEFNRWGGDFGDDVLRILGENIAILFPVDQVVLNYEISPVKIDYQVIAHIRELDGELGGKVILNVDWSILKTSAKRAFVARKSIFTENCRDQSYQAYVAAQSTLLARFSREIVAAIQSDL